MRTPQEIKKEMNLEEEADFMDWDIYRKLEKEYLEAKELEDKQ